MSRLTCIASSPALLPLFQSLLLPMLLLLHCSKSLTCTPFSCISATPSTGQALLLLVLLLLPLPQAGTAAAAAV
jgi:hypothetical protein